MTCPITGELKCKCMDKNLVTFDPNIKDSLRKLFTDHAVYTKMFIESALEGIPDVKTIERRLMRNQEDIGNFLSLKLDSKKGKNITKLLKEHISLAAACVTS